MWTVKQIIQSIAKIHETSFSVRRQRFNVTEVRSRSELGLKKRVQLCSERTPSEEPD